MGLRARIYINRMGEREIASPDLVGIAMTGDSMFFLVGKSHTF